jgi:hypothetical protein
MNVIEFKSTNTQIAYCFVDNTHQYTSAWTRELIKNQSDYSISNLIAKKYSVYQGQSEDRLLNHVANLGYKTAVVFSTGTEFINGDSFFKQVVDISTTDFFIYGHILDRNEAYYELHHQCFVINLDKYRLLGCPEIGQQQLGLSHNKLAPIRSIENIHDNYTPVCVEIGTVETTYQHKLHGYNIISSGLAAGYKINAFTHEMRKNKKHYYPENQQEFLKHSEWIYTRQNYCATEFIHTENTETIKPLTGIQQIYTPASGTHWLDIIDTSNPVTVVFYDYNEHALEYWKTHAPIISNVTYQYVKLDLLCQEIDLSMLDSDLPTFINLSNIFAYEGTTFLYSLEYRLTKENQTIEKIKECIPDAYINFCCRASTGFYNSALTGKHLNTVSIEQLDKPTWHIGDWL